MKHFYFVLVMLLAFMSAGCSNSFDDVADNANPTSGAERSHQRISKEDAASIANMVLKKSTTRGESSTTPTFEYVMSGNITRNFTLPDTLAYILNYPNESGFAIIATDKRVYPVLAYSEKGSFSLDNEIVKANFIDRIEAYMEEADPNASYEVSEGDFDGCAGVVPAVQVSLGQWEPWNKYIVKEHPDCPTGCVAVATALVMSHSKQILTYHNSVYHFQSILSALSKASVPNNTPQKIVNGGEPTYTYNQAVDSMAKVLYWIGKDVGMDYTTNGSAADSDKAFKLCKSLNFKMTSYAKYNVKEIIKYLNDNYIIYLRGEDGKNGHAWVSDGCRYCINPQTKEFENIYIHCDWGWGGLGNGYYSGDVFKVLTFNYAPKNYFAVKKEY